MIEYKTKILFVLSFLVTQGAVLLMTNTAHAQFTLQAPTTLNMSPTSGCVGMRLHPISGVWKAHKGQDIAGAIGTPIIIQPGYSSVDYDTVDHSGEGNSLTVRYPNGVVMQYFHLSGFSAGPPPIPFIGNTGGSTGPHLHYQVSIDGQIIDPYEAYGLNLDDPTIRSCLKKDGIGRLSGGIRACESRNVCRGGGDPGNFTPLTPPPPGTPDPYAPPFDLDVGAPGRPPITPPVYQPPTLSGGPEDNVGLPQGGPVLWDSSEYLTGGLTDNACDTDVFVIMRGRAAMEAQEDVVTSEIVMHRPDSVMEYTCLDQYMGFTAERGDALFSGRDLWEGATVDSSSGQAMPINVSLQTDSLDQVLEETVISSIYDYVSQQFPMTFLGGTVAGMDSTITDSIGGATYTCSQMNDVWQIAKCENFADPRYFTGDGPFYTYNEMVPNTNDPRTQHGACGDTGLSEVDVDVMTNLDLAYHGFDPAALPNQDIGAYVDPTVCVGLDPIPTGVHIVAVDNFNTPTQTVRADYEEHFCANPGCYYDFANDVCTK